MRGRATSVPVRPRVRVGVRPRVRPRVRVFSCCHPVKLFIDLSSEP